VTTRKENTFSPRQLKISSKSQAPLVEITDENVTPSQQLFDESETNIQAKTGSKNQKLETVDEGEKRSKVKTSDREEKEDEVAFVDQ